MAQERDEEYLGEYTCKAPPHRLAEPDIVAGDRGKNLASTGDSLQAVVMPSTVIVKDGETVKFAIHGFIEFKSLAEVFPYIEAQTSRWNGKITEAEKTRTCASATARGD